MRASRIAVAACVSLGVSACAATMPIPVDKPVLDEAAYTREHPYYLEFCALSEIQKKPGFGADIRGGVGGHSTIYLNGVCLRGAGYPDIEVCPEAPASKGVGLSVNAHFANANWVAIPGRDFFYHGDLRPGQALTRDVYNATKAHAKRLGIYDAIRFHDRVFEDSPAGYTHEAFKYEVSIGTDYATGYARNRICARVPVSKTQMRRVTDYLNQLNRPYRDGKADYEWSVLTDNCIHVAHNALTAIGFWPLWATHRSILVSAFDFPVPKNEFVNIMRRANDMPIDNLIDIWNDRSARRALLANEGLPTRYGALATFDPVVHDNAIYETDLQLIFYDEPVFGRYEDRYRRILTQPRYADLLADRQYFERLYTRIEAERRPLSWWRANHPGLASQTGFSDFYAHFYQEVAARAALIAAVDTAAPGLAAFGSKPGEAPRDGG